MSQAVAWLASDGTSHITGQIFVVIGGDVHRLVPFQVAASIHADDGWTVETLTAAQGRLVGDEPLDRRRPTWCAEPGRRRRRRRPGQELREREPRRARIERGRR